MSDKNRRKSKKAPAARTQRRAFRRRFGAGLSRGLQAVGHGFASAGRAVGHGLSAAGRAIGGFFVRIRRGLLYAVGTCAMIGVCAVILAAVVSAGVKNVTAPYLLSPEAAAAEAQREDFDCILVLGAGLRNDNSPSPMLYDRVLTAVELTEALPDSCVLLMSGDHTGDYNEPAVMKDTAASLGIDSRLIFLDHKGYSTYESVSRVRDVFGAKRVLIVTQEYHLYRAVYIARTLGLDAYGLPADKRPYRKQLLRETRELLARYKDFFAAGRGLSASGGDAPVDLDGDGNLT